MVHKLQIEEVSPTVTRIRSVVSQLIACMAPNLLLLDLGMAISFATIAVPDLLHASEGLSLDETQASWFGSISFLTQPLGAIISGPIVDYFGRKKANFLVNIPHLVAWVLMYYAWNLPSLFIANGLLGLGTGVMEAPINSYVGEISEPSVRGALCTVTQLFTSVGILVMFFLGTVVNWRNAALICLAIPICSMLFVLLVPETPVWLLTRGREKEALKSLCYLRGWTSSEHVRDEYDNLVVYSRKLQRCVICESTGSYDVECEHYKMHPIRRFLLKFKMIILCKETLRPLTLVMMYFMFFVMSGLTPIRPNMRNVCGAFGMADDPKNIIVSSMAFLCQPLGSIFSGPLLDCFGRKKALFLVNIPHLIAWILMYSAWNVPSLFIANALLGIGTGIMEAPSVTYVGEVSDPAKRGILTTLTNAFTSSGIFVAYLLGTVLHWRQAALVSLTVPLATMVLVLFVPETPIWLISKGRQKEALKSLCRLRGWAEPEDVQEEFNQLLQYNEAIHQCVVCLREGKLIEPCTHESNNIFKRTAWTFKNVFLVKETLRPFLLVMAYFFFHTMSGLAPIRPNMVNICKALGMKYDSKPIVVIVGAVYIVMSVISATIVKFTGKRKLILVSLFGTACCSLSISIYSARNLSPEVFTYEPSTFPDQKELLPVILFLGLVCFYALGIPWVLLSEVFPFRSRGMATGLSAALSYTIFFIASKTNYNIEAAFHLSGTYAIYACFGLIGVIYLYFFLPETEKKTLLEIEAYYKGDQMIFADDFFINSFKKKRTNSEGAKPMLVNGKNNEA